MSISIQVRGVEEAKKRLEELKEDFANARVELNEEGLSSNRVFTYPVESVKMEWNRGLKPDEGYANMMSASTSSFSFDVKYGAEDFAKAMESMAPGKPVIISGNNTNVSANVPAVEWKVDDSFIGNCIYAMASGSPKKEVETDFPSLDTEGEMQYRCIYTRGNSNGSIAQAEGQVVQFSGPMRVESHSDGDMIRVSLTGTGLWSSSNYTFPPIETIMKDLKRMKKKYDSWITFEEKTGHWNKTIVKAMSGHKPSIKKMQNLSVRHVCIMGTAWDGNPIWNKEGEATPCSACEKLGTDLLYTFTRPTDGYGYYPTIAERFEEYKLMFEWHWNNAHASH